MAGVFWKGDGRPPAATAAQQVAVIAAKNKVRKGGLWEQAPKRVWDFITRLETRERERLGEVQQS